MQISQPANQPRYAMPYHLSIAAEASIVYPLSSILYALRITKFLCFEKLYCP